MIGETFDATMTILYEDIHAGDPRYSGGVGLFVQVQHWRAERAGTSLALVRTLRCTVEGEPVQEYWEQYLDPALAVQVAVREFSDLREAFDNEDVES